MAAWSSGHHITRLSCNPEGIEWFIEDQAFLLSYNSAPRPPSPSPVSKLSLFLSLPVCRLSISMTIHSILSAVVCSWIFLARIIVKICLFWASQVILRPTAERSIGEYFTVNFTGGILTEHRSVLLSKGFSQFKNLPFFLSTILRTF